MARASASSAALALPEGMKKNQRLPQPLFDPTTKEAVHDRALTPEQMIAEGFITRDAVRAHQGDCAGAVSPAARTSPRATGFVLVDTKYEFGTDANGDLVLIDEIHTPDSSRYWQLDSYEARFAAGEEPQYFDKEFLRLWFIKNSDPYGDAKLPDAPADLVQELSRRYIEMYEQITGAKIPARRDAGPAAHRAQPEIFRPLIAIAAKPAGACRAAR